MGWPVTGSMGPGTMGGLTGPGGLVGFGVTGFGVVGLLASCHALEQISAGGINSGSLHSAAEALQARSGLGHRAMIWCMKAIVLWTAGTTQCE